MQKWEYLQVAAAHDASRNREPYVWAENGTTIGTRDNYWILDNQPLIGYLNQLGEQGWEMVSVSGNDERGVIFFKRPK